MAPALNACGDCGACCTLLGIETLGKPAGPRCQNLGACGCAIYEARPPECRGFRCAWLKSQALPQAARMDPAWRPDRAGFIVYSDRGDMRLNVVVDPADPGAWRRAPYHAHIMSLSRRAAEGLELVVYVGERRTVVFPDREIDLGAVAPDEEIASGYAEQDGRMVPYAEVLGRSRNAA